MSMQGQTRVLREDLRQRTGWEAPAEHAVMNWMVRHSCWLLQRFQSYRGGASAHERLTGAAYLGQCAAFGELVLARRRYETAPGGVQRRPKLEVMWQRGVYLGRTAESDEHLVAIDGKVSRHRCVRRLTAPDCESRGDLEMLSATPSSVASGTAAPMPADAGPQILFGAPGPAPAAAPAAPPPPPAQAAQRRYNSQRLAVPTLGCAGCVPGQGGAKGRHHSVPCNRRAAAEAAAFAATAAATAAAAATAQAAASSSSGAACAPPASDDGAPGVKRTAAERASSSSSGQLAIAPGPLEMDCTELAVEDDMAHESKKTRVAAIAALRAAVATPEDEKENEKTVLMGAENEEEAKGMRDELRNLHEFDVFERISVNDLEALGVTRGSVIPTKWVKQVKPDATVRARVVATEVRYGPVDADLFAPTPTTATLRLVLAHASYRMQVGGRDAQWLAGRRRQRFLPERRHRRGGRRASTAGRSQD